MLFFLLMLFALQSPGSTCHWAAPVQVGNVWPPIVEDSGLAISAKYPNRLYHVNDSGDSGRFFITDLKGEDTKIVNIAGFQPLDAEELALGRCSESTDCLFIGDIGDNFKFRRIIELVIVEEQKEFPSEVQPTRRVRLRYPDHAHDAEAMAVHPDGTVFILTKEHQAQLFRLPKEKWMNAGDRVETLEPVTSFDFDILAPGVSNGGRLPTAMDISRDGKRVLLLTYIDAFELFLDFANPIPPVSSWRDGKQFRRIRVEILKQQEGIAFTPDGKSFYYDTENQNTPGKLMRADCVAAATSPRPRRP